MPEVQFQPGSKTLLVSLLESIKDFLPTNAANLIFTPRGLALRFASGRNTDSRVVVACHLDAEANHRPFTFTRTAVPTRRRSSTGPGSRTEADDVMSDAGESVISAPEKMDREKLAAQQAVSARPDPQGVYGIIGKYVCQREAVLIGFNPQLMIDQLQLVDEEDAVTIRAEEAEDGTVSIYEMYIESRDLTRKCLYEVDAISLIDRFAPLPDIQYNVVCQIETKEFNRIVNALHATSDKIVIMANKNSITFCASGSDGTLQVGLVQKPSSSNEKKPPRFKIHAYHSAVKHVVDSRLLKGFTKASPLSPHVLLLLPATPSPARPIAPIRITYEITVFELPSGNVILASEFDPLKHLPPIQPVVKQQNTGTGWRTSGESSPAGWNNGSKRSSVIDKRNSVSSVAEVTSDVKTFANVVSKDKESTSPSTTTSTTPATPNSGFLGIGAPRSATPVGVHATGAGLGATVHEEAAEVQVRVVGQLHYLLAGELGM